MNQATSPQRWQQVKAIFQNVVELDAQERAAFLASLRVDDQPLRPQVERMLAADDSADSFLENSPVHHLIEAAQQVKIGQTIDAIKSRNSSALVVGGSVRSARHAAGTQCCDQVIASDVHDGCIAGATVRA